MPLILSGKKAVTWRLFDDKDLKRGDEIAFLDKATGKEFAKAVLTEVREKALKDIKETDLQGHEAFSSQEAMTAHYRGLYGDKVVPESIVKIISFRLVQ